MLPSAPVRDRHLLAALFINKGKQAALVVRFLSLRFFINGLAQILVNGLYV